MGSEIKIILNQYNYDSSERFKFVPFAEALSTNGNLYEISGNGAAIQKVVVSDVDGDYDLDLVILKTIAGDVGEVSWYENTTDWFVSPPEFNDPQLPPPTLEFSSVSKIISTTDVSMSYPSVLESFDSLDSENTKSMNPFYCRDFLVGAENGIFLINRITDANAAPSAPVEITDSVDGGVLQLKVIVFPNDTQGYVYSTTNTKKLYYSEGIDPSGSRILIEGIEAQTIAVLYQEDGAGDLLVSEQGESKIHFLDLENISSSSPILDLEETGINGSIIGMSLVDLNRVSSFLDYDMDDPANVFDHARLRLDGRLYFKVIPDFEDRKGTGNGTSNSNFYEARITVSQASNSQIKDELLWWWYKLQMKKNRQYLLGWLRT